MILFLNFRASRYGTGAAVEQHSDWQVEYIYTKVVSCLMDWEREMCLPWMIGKLSWCWRSILAGLPHCEACLKRFLCSSFGLRYSITHQHHDKGKNEAQADKNMRVSTGRIFHAVTLIGSITYISTKVKPTPMFHVVPGRSLYLVPKSTFLSKHRSKAPSWGGDRYRQPPFFCSISAAVAIHNRRIKASTPSRAKKNALPEPAKGSLRWWSHIWWPVTAKVKTVTMTTRGQHRISSWTVLHHRSAITHLPRPKRHWCSSTSRDVRRRSWWRPETPLRRQAERCEDNIGVWDCWKSPWCHSERGYLARESGQQIIQYRKSRTKHKGEVGYDSEFGSTISGTTQWYSCTNCDSSITALSPAFKYN